MRLFEIAQLTHFTDISPGLKVGILKQFMVLILNKHNWGAPFCSMNIYSDPSMFIDYQLLIINDF